MEKFDELLKELKQLNITQSSIDWMEDLPQELWENHFKGNHKNVASGLGVDKHRWYELSTAVVEVYDRLLGIAVISDIYSEAMMVGDCYHTIEFFEMKKVTVVSYEIENNP